jgi:DNA-binding transcriptional MocR family regulator
MSRPPYIGLHVASGERRATAADIVASVQREIASGGLPAGSRLPPVRALENQLGLSKNTAQAAYDELVARGLVEAVVAEFLDCGYYDTHLQALQRALDVRYAACLAALDELMPDGVRWTRPGGGPTLWLELPRSVDYAAIEAHLAGRGIHVSNASAAYVGEPHLHGFRIAYAYLPEHQMRAALTILGDGLRALMR